MLHYIIILASIFFGLFRRCCWITARSSQESFFWNPSTLALDTVHSLPKALLQRLHEHDTHIQLYFHFLKGVDSDNLPAYPIPHEQWGLPILSNLSSANASRWQPLLSLNAALLGRARVHSLCADVHPTVRGTGLIALQKQQTKIGRHELWAARVVSRLLNQEVLKREEERCSEKRSRRRWSWCYLWWGSGKVLWGQRGLIVQERQAWHWHVIIIHLAARMVSTP